MYPWETQPNWSILHSPQPYTPPQRDAENKGRSVFADAFYEIAKSKIECAESIRLRLIKHGHYVPEKQQEIEERYDRLSTCSDVSNI